MKDEINELLNVIDSCYVKIDEEENNIYKLQNQINDLLKDYSLFYYVGNKSIKKYVDKKFGLYFFIDLSDDDLNVISDLFDNYEIEVLHNIKCAVLR